MEEDFAMISFDELNTFFTWYMISGCLVVNLNVVYQALSYSSTHRSLKEWLILICWMSSILKFHILSCKIQVTYIDLLESISAKWIFLYNFTVSLKIFSDLWSKTSTGLFTCKCYIFLSQFCLLRFVLSWFLSFDSFTQIY